MADVLINLHTMNPLFGARPYSVYKLHPRSPVSEGDLLAAMAPFFPHLACRMDVGGQGELPGNIAGALDYQCLNAGICAFMLELGSGNRFEADNIELAERGFAVLAQQMGILPGPPGAAARQLRRVSKRGWVTAQEGGLFVPGAQAGDSVPAGRSIGELLQLTGERIKVPEFTQDGILIGLRSDPVVHTGERLAFVAWQWDDLDVPRAKNRT